LYSILVHILEVVIPIKTNSSQARAHFTKLLDEVSQNREVVVIQRRGAGDVAMIAATELSSLLGTAYLLRSPHNAERLLATLGRALKEETTPQALEELRRV
jgi:antitoxin YefM